MKKVFSHFFFKIDCFNESDIWKFTQWSRIIHLHYRSLYIQSIILFNLFLIQSSIRFNTSSYAVLTGCFGPTMLMNVILWDGSSCLNTWYFVPVDWDLMYQTESWGPSFCGFVFLVFSSNGCSRPSILTARYFRLIVRDGVGPGWWHNVIMRCWMFWMITLLRAENGTGCWWETQDQIGLYIGVAVTWSTVPWSGAFND